MLDVIGVTATVICAVVGIINLVRAIIKDIKKSSNHPRPR